MEPVKCYVNSCLESENVATLLLNTLNSIPLIILEDVKSNITKLIIDITRKEACYDPKCWLCILSGIEKLLKDTSGRINVYMLAFILKLALCCYHKLSFYQEVEQTEIRKKWIVVVQNLLLIQTDRDEGHQHYRVIILLFLFQTILKAGNESILTELFINSLNQLPSSVVRAGIFELFLRVSALLPFETEIMKLCSDLLSSILLKGTEPEANKIAFPKADLAGAFSKLISVCSSIPQGGKIISFENLLALESSTLNYTLIEQLIANPQLIKYEEESKMQSTNYYFSTLLTMSHAAFVTKSVEILQENLLAICSHFMCESIEETNPTQIAYLNAVYHMYISYTAYLLTKGMTFAIPQDVLEMILLATEHALRILDYELLQYFRLLLSAKGDVNNLAELLKNIIIICGDPNNTFQKLSLNDIDITFLIQLNNQQTISSIHEKIFSEFNTKVQDANTMHLAFLKILESHYINQIPSSTNNIPLENTCKVIFSTLQIIRSLSLICTKLSSQSQNQVNAIKILSTIQSYAILQSSCPSIKTSIIELCKTTEKKPESIQSTTCGLIMMNRISQTLNFVVQSTLASQKDIFVKSISMLLDIWRSFSLSIESPKAMTDVLVPKDIAGYEFSQAIGEISTLLDFTNSMPELTFHLLSVLCESIQKIDPTQFSTIQEHILKMSPKVLQELLTYKDADQKLMSLFSLLANNSDPIRENLVNLVIDLILANPKLNQDFLKKILKFLTEIISQHREIYVKVLIDKILPFAQNCTENSTQEILLTYMTSISYQGLNVLFGKEDPNKKKVVDLGEEVIEGYGIEEYVKREEQLRPGSTCSYLKSRRKNESEPWYNCFTCGLIDNKGCCAVCAKICHKNHKVSFVKVSPFLCHCHSDGNCIAGPKDYDNNDSEGSQNYYLGGYKKYMQAKDKIGFESEFRGELNEDSFSPRVLGINVEKPLRVHEKEQDSKDEDQFSESMNIIQEDVLDKPLQPDIIQAPSQIISVENLAAEKEVNISSESILPPRDVSYESNIFKKLLL